MQPLNAFECSSSIISQSSKWVPCKKYLAPQNIIPQNIAPLGGTAIVQQMCNTGISLQEYHALCNKMLATH